MLEDFAVAAIKIGMLGSAEIVGAVAEGFPPSPRSGAAGARSAPEARALHRLRSCHGRLLRRRAERRGLRRGGPRELLPLVDCLTPNLAEAAALLGEPVARSEADMARQGAALLKLGPRAVLMKGGHLDGDEAVDLLVTAQRVRRFAAPRIASRNLHGTGCTLSSAIAAHVVLGMALPEAVAAAKAFVREAIERGRDVTLGGGAGPLIQSEAALETLTRPAPYSR